MDSDQLLLSQLSPFQVAQMIRALDSRLIGIEADAVQGEELALVYSFAVAGRIQRFHISVSSAAVPSIAALYPAAEEFEVALERRLGVVFLADGASE